MRRVQNLSNQTRVHNKIACKPKQFADLPDGVAAVWVERFGCTYADSPEPAEEAKPKRGRPRKEPTEDRL